MRRLMILAAMLAAIMLPDAGRAAAIHATPSLNTHAIVHFVGDQVAADDLHAREVFF